VDFDHYVAARYGRLIEHAVLLGCAEGEAGTVVDRVLLEQRKQIRRADDPDPIVHAAIESAVNDTPQKARRRGGPLLAFGAVAAVVAVGIAVTYRPAPRPVPSLFAMDASQAQQLLEDDGYAVQVLPTASCEPEGLVLGSDPPAGRFLGRGDTVTVRTATHSGGYCPVQALARADGWAFVQFALGGPAPMFADTVQLIVDDGAPVTLTHDEAIAHDRWGTLSDLLANAARQTSPTLSGMPSLHAEATLPTTTTCGLPRPAAMGVRFALRVQVDDRGTSDGQGCVLTFDLYRSERVIDTVVVYTAGG
jgi:hypothetical protein